MNDTDIVAMILVGVLIIFSLVMLSEVPEKNLWNKTYGTNYSIVEWVFTKDTIKNYVHKGEQKTLNLKLNAGASGS